MGKIDKKSSAFISKSIDKSKENPPKIKKFLYKKPAFKPAKTKTNHFEKKTETRKIKNIALYKDRQPIIGLRKKPFFKKISTQAVPAEELKPVYPGEQPEDFFDLETCPKCKREFCPEAFRQHIHICDRVFMKRMKEFDMQAKRMFSE